MLPPEIVDHIVDLLHYDRETLKQCCLVSKSWIPRTRRYLFANIFFHSTHAFESWNNTFPDPTNSPASRVSTLRINSIPEVVERADWIRSFSCVAELRLRGRPTLPLALFHGLSINLRSLYMRFTTFSYPDLFNFICSFPHLENLNLVCKEVPQDDGNTSLGSLTSPPLTGSLSLIMFRGMGATLRHLMSLPNGLRFRELVFLLVQENDLRWIKELVFKCSDTLECLEVKCVCSYDPDLIDLSKATKLKDLIFRLGDLRPGLVIPMLEAITPEHRHIQQISIYLPYIPHSDARSRPNLYEKWLRLDCLLVQFWESRSIRPRVVVVKSLWTGTRGMKDWIGCFLPEITARGIIDFFCEEHL